MPIIEIRLPSSIWKYDPSDPLGPPGGFGAVFRGVSATGCEVAVKRLHIDAVGAAHRELTIAQDLAKREFLHVMPVLDAGQDADSGTYYVVMPVADHSLQDYLNTTRLITESIVTDILLQISQGLEEAQHLVHRDLKPGNVLLHEGRWKIADYGIARFVEDSTSARTLKECLSPSYAAPEQWRLEHATSAVDVYALGCVAYALLAGKPPFVGTIEMIRDGHLHDPPASIPEIGPKLQALIAMMLRKSPAARPSRSRIITVLSQIRESGGVAQSNDPLHRIAVSAAAHERARAAAEAEGERRRTASVQRQALVIDAEAILKEIGEELRKRISDIPNVIIPQSNSLIVQVGDVAMDLQLNVKPVEAGDFAQSKWDVICGAIIIVQQLHPEHRRAASLWYTRQAAPDAEYRWYEVGYEGNPLFGRGFEFQPTAVVANLADVAHAMGTGVVQQSYYPVPIDGEDMEAFCTRWLYIFATACEKRLQDLPSGLPNLRE